MKDSGVGAVLFSATEVTEPFPTLKKTNGMIFEKNTVNEEIDGNGITISIFSDGNLKSHPLSYIEVRNELL